MEGHKKWHQGTTQEAIDKLNEASREFWKQVFDAIFDAINTRTLRCGRCGRQYYWSTRYVGLFVDWYTLLKEGAYDKK